MTKSAAPTSTPAPKPARFEARLTNDGIALDLPWKPKELFRGHGKTGQLFQPVAIAVDSSESTTDSNAPDGTLLFYRTVSPNGENLLTSVTSAPKRLPPLRKPRLLVDKSTYTLSVIDGDSVVKRYAVGLGADPKKRKLCQDNQTTPEGLYTIINLQPQATFHKAYDLNYPNEVDQIRYSLGQQTGLVPPGREIGGEIQIHGLGSAGNWTFGCISLNNPELDELFAHPEIGTDTEVFVCGSEIRPSDRKWLLSPPVENVRQLQLRLRDGGLYDGPLDGSLGPASMLALGRYQLSQGLATTCQLDGKTRRHLKWPD